MLLRAVFEDEGLIGWKAFQENRTQCEILKPVVMFTGVFQRVLSVTLGN
jgi:hypothetical protein